MLAPKEALVNAHHAGGGLKEANSDASLNQQGEIAAHSADHDFGTGGAGQLPRLRRATSFSSSAASSSPAS